MFIFQPAWESSLQAQQRPTHPQALHAHGCYRSISLMAFHSRCSMAITPIHDARYVRDGDRVRERMGTHRDAHRARDRAPSRIVMVIKQNDVDAPAA